MFPSIEAGVIKLIYLNLGNDKSLAENYLKSNFKEKFID